MENRKYRPRSIDRAVFAILATLHIVNSIYLIGPWYLDSSETGRAPLYALFNSDSAVAAYGSLLLLDGLALLYATVGRSTRRFYTQIVSGALLSGFLLRLYSLIGVFIALESWRPPSYLSHTASVLLLGSYWVWVRVNARPTE